MKLQIKKFLTIIILNLFVFVMTSAVYAKSKAYVKEGTYLGAFLTRNYMSGDFDGTIAELTYSELYDVPNLDEGTGFGIVLGSRGPGGAFELGYQRSRHDTTSFIGVGESEASYNVIDMNFKIDVFAQKQIKPYVLLGFGFPWLTIKDSMIDRYDLSVSDETYIGYALNAGVGVAYYFHPQWAVTGGIIKRWNWFSSVEGVDLADSLSEKTFCLNIGIAYTF